MAKQKIKQRAKRMPKSPPVRYRDSYRLLFQPKTLTLLFYDLLFWVLAMAGGIAASRAAQQVVGSLQVLQLDVTDVSAVAENTVRGAMGLLAIIVAVFFLWALISWVFTRGIIWNTLVGAPKRGFKFWGKFFLVALVWNIIVIALWAFVLKIAQQFIPYKSFLYPGNLPWLALVMALLLAVTFYFTELLHYLFVRSGEIRSLRRVMHIGIRHYRRLIRPYAAVAGTFAAIMVLSIPLNFLPDKVSTILSSALLLLYFVWARYYLAGVFKWVLE